MTGVWKTPGFLSKGMGGRGQGTNIVTPHIPVPFVGVPGVSGILEGYTKIGKVDYVIKSNSHIDLVV